MNVDIEVPAHVVTQRAQELLRQGRYERRELDVAMTTLTFTRPLIEIGGGIGYTSCILNRALPERIRPYHYVLEPHPVFATITERNRDRNGMAFQVLQEAIGYGVEHIDLQDLRVLGGPPKARKLGEGTVEATTLDALFARLPVETFELVMDAEGIEGAVVVEDLGSIAEACPRLTFEYHPEWDDHGWAEIEASLHSHGYVEVAKRVDAERGTQVYGFQRDGADFRKV